MMDAGGRCPCGTGLTYRECCEQVHTGVRRAATAEQLMRSRYSAFAVGLPDYLLASWHPSTRPDSVELEADLIWRSLDIVGLAGGGPFDTSGAVEFRAAWRQGAQRGVLHERSSFLREGGAWFYVDGELLPG